MTETPGFPAPGSSVPGAPPALKRALVPADGVPIAPSIAPGGLGEHEVDVPPANESGSSLMAAAAMLGIAVGLELAGLSRRRRRKSLQMLT